jgi:GntR family phosphonate transport system transcriptional regulator
MTAALFALPDDPNARLWPLWRQAEHAILAAIESRRLGAGDQLPPEHQLASELGTHRHTVRRAVDSLVGRGVLEVRRGRGTYVTPGPIPYRIGRRSRFTENMEKVGCRPAVRILRSATTAADAEVAHRLRLDGGTSVVVLELLRSGDDIPIVLARHSVPADRFPDFAERFAEIRSITRTFASYDVVGYTRKATRISARLPTHQEADDLAISISAPVLVWGSVHADTKGRPINLDASTFAASRVDIVFEDENPSD